MIKVLRQKRIVNFIIDFDELFKSLDKKFEALYQSVRFLYKDLIPFSHNFIFNIFEKWLDRIKFDVLPFRILCHFFHCYCDSESVNKC